jgi:Lrp/AsnC family transcriptional regulator, leucine-responsive regulatory protein
MEDLRQMDDVDLAILRELQHDGRLSLAELGRRVGLTVAPVQRRLRTLERDGSITRYVALLDPRWVRCDFEAFVEVQLSVESAELLDQFEDMVHALPEVTECHRVTGDSHYLLKVVTRDGAAFDAFYSQHLLALPGMERMRQQVSLRRVKYTTALPVPHAARDV